MSMTEREKMIAGEIYDANNDKQLVDERTRCKERLYDYNLLRPSDRDIRTRLICEILGSVGKGMWIETPFYCDYGSLINVGRNFYANHNCVMLDGGGITFGDNVFVAPNCCFTTAEHMLDAPHRIAGLERARPIRVGDNVWIGANVTVLPGVTIGDGCVIGAGSVVTRDIPAGMIAYGNPCRPHRKAE